MAEHAATQTSAKPAHPLRVGLIVVGCVLVLVLATALVFEVTMRWGDFRRISQQDRAWWGIKNIQNALKLYYTKKGNYPDTDAGLRALVDLQALESIPRDPWDHEYIYLNEGGKPVITSYGPDGTLGGGDDISSKDAEASK